MYNDELEKLILAFTGQSKTSPAKYIAGLLQEYNDYDEYITIIKDVLVKREIEKVNEILDFLGYLINETSLIPGDSDDELVCKINADDEIFLLLENLIFSDSLDIKLKVLNFFSVIAYEEFADFLEKEFNTISRKDPVICTNVIAAINAIKDEIPWNLVDVLVRSSHYPVRWSFFDLFSLTGMNYEKTYAYLKQLKKDGNSYIQAEAVYYEKYLEIMDEDVSINPFLENIQQKRIREIVPEIAYSHIKDGFTAYIEKTGLKEYSLELFMEFIEFFIANKDLNIVNAFIKKKIQN